MDWNYTEKENFSNYFQKGKEGDLFPEIKVLNLVHTALFAICGILIICGFVENVLVCWILIRTKKFLKSFSNFHLLNLAVADLIFRIVSNPDRFIQTPFAVSDLRCKVVEFGKYATLSVTFCLLAGIAFDRYMHIVHPFKARSITWRHSLNVVVLSWIYGAACSAPFLYSAESVIVIDTEEEFSFCDHVLGLAFPISLTVFLCCSFIIPLVSMGFAYGKILHFLWSRTRSTFINSQVARTKFRFVKMMLLVVFTYLITWGPQLILQTIDAFEIFKESIPVEEMEDYNVEEEFEGTSEAGGTNSWIQISHHIYSTELYFLLHGIFDTLTLASSVLNPLIFGYYNRTFSNELRKFCCRTKRCGGLCFTKRKQEVQPCVKKRGVQAKETDSETTRL